jgi:hypothetical protein
MNSRNEQSKFDIGRQMLSSKKNIVEFQTGTIMNIIYVQDE